MKTLFVSVFLLLGNLCAAQAQVNAPPSPIPEAANTVPDSSAAPAKISFLDSLAVAGSLTPPLSSDVFSTPELATALPADPATPSPKPKFLYGGRDDYRWQLSVGVTWFRFNSNVFSANAAGLKTTVSYFLNDWLGVEGSFTGAFAPGFIKNEEIKLATYGGGLKVAWRQKRWEPWLHALFGGAHEGPQTAAGSNNSYSITAGGGGDYRWNPRISFRAEGNYVRTAFFSQSQNNFQLLGGIVIHF